MDIRSEIWLKVWGNLSFNPISALTHAMGDTPRSRAKADRRSVLLGSAARLFAERGFDRVSIEPHAFA